MRRQTLKNQLIDTGVRYIVRNVRDVEFTASNRGTMASGLISYQGKRRAVSKHYDDGVNPEDLQPWTFDGTDDSNFTWDDFEAGDVPEDDETMYRLIGDGRH